MKRVQIVNNLFAGLDSTKWGSNGRFILIADGEDISLENNTAFTDGNIITAYGAPSKRFIFRNNIVSYNDYGFNGGNGEGIKQILPTYFPDGAISNNLIVNGKNISTDYLFVPPRNLFAENYNAVGFVNLQAGNYRLSPNSKYKNKGADGKNLGADIDAIEAEIKKAQ